MTRFGDAPEMMQHAIAALDLPPALAEQAHLEVDRDVVLWLGEDIYSRVEAGPRPVVAVTSVPGAAMSMEPWDDVQRVRVEVYGRGLDIAAAVARSIHEGLTWTDHDTPAGFIDDVVTITAPYDTQLAHDTVSMYAAVYDIIQRPM